MHDQRLARLRKRLAARRLNALFVSDISNIFYLTGYTGSDGSLIVTLNGAHLLVDSRYTLQARDECKCVMVREFSRKPAITAVGELIDELAPNRVGFEAENLTVYRHANLRKAVGRRTSLRATHGIVEELRRIKDEHEIALIRTAAGIADSAFESVLMEVEPGMAEKEIALLIDVTLRKMGADAAGFETIAATGPNSALPHAQPTDRIWQAGDLLKMDFGARYKGYNSDITRTICAGKPSKKQREVYNIVLDAQRRAIDAIAPGKSGREIDAVARDYIASKGYGDNFGHGLGHGLGIGVHDHHALSAMSDLALEPGMVVTVEPGIYIEGWGGVRIEDDVLVTESGAEVLTTSPRSLTTD